MDEIISSRKRLEALDGDHFRAHGFVGVESMSGDGHDVSLLNVSNEIGEEVFKPILMDAISFLSSQADLVPYESGYRPDRHQACVLEVDTAEEIRALSAGILDLQNLSYFGHEPSAINRLRFHGFVGEKSGGTPVATIRLISPKKELGKSRFFGLAFSGGNYNRVDDRTFLFDSATDFVLHEHLLYILNGSAFDRMFGRIETEMSEVRAGMALILGRIPVSNADELIYACVSQMQMRSKIRSIAKKAYLARVTMDNIRATIDEFSLDIDIDDDGLVFDNAPSRRWEILKLLDDDYLGSVMTGEKYETNSKRSWRRGS